MTDTDTAANELAMQLVHALHSAARGTAGQLIENLTEQLADSRAEVDAIRTRVSELLDGDYAPSADAMMRALWPNDVVRERFREDRFAS